MFGWINVSEVIFKSRESGGNTHFEGHFLFIMGFPCGSVGKEFACNAGDLGSVPELGRSSGEGKGYPLQYSGLENSTGCKDHGGAKSRTRLSDFHSTSTCHTVIMKLFNFCRTSLT